MIEHFALRFCVAYHQFRAQIEVLLPIEAEHRSKPLNERALSAAQKSFIADAALRPMLAELNHLQFPNEIRTKASRLFARLADQDSRTWTAESLLDALTDLNGDISRELAKHKFVQLLSPNDQYLGKEQLLGAEVYEKFPKIRPEIKEVGVCFAVELYTASVFHLMRVAEHGLRVIARRLKVKIIQKGQNVPLQYGDWNQVIQAINNKIDAARKLAGATKQARLDYYSDAVERCAAMKDLYRNPVSHTRTTYTEHKALDAMERVRNFMQFLARPVPR